MLAIPCQAENLFAKTLSITSFGNASNFNASKIGLIPKKLMQTITNIISASQACIFLKNLMDSIWNPYINAKTRVIIPKILI